MIIEIMLLKNHTFLEKYFFTWMKFNFIYFDLFNTFLVHFFNDYL